MRQIIESDWQALKPLHAVALERFCEFILAEVTEITNDDDKTAHRKYLEVFDIVQRRDKEIALMFNDLRRSRALMQLAAIRKRGLLTDDEFAQFSEETRAIIALLLQH